MKKLLWLLLIPIKSIAAPINLEITWDTAPYVDVTGVMQATCTDGITGYAPLNGTIRIVPDLDPRESITCRILATSEGEVSESAEVSYTRPLVPSPNAVIRRIP